MKRLMAGLALLTSLAAGLVTVGGGLALLLIKSSGERGAGALLVLAGAITFAAAMVLIFADAQRFAGRSGRALAVVAAILGVLPVAAVSAAALRFARLPVKSPIPTVDWSVFAAGLLFALGALSILGIGYQRRREAVMPRAPDRPRASSEPPAAPPHVAPPEQRLETARPRQAPPEIVEETHETEAAGEGDDIRVTPVELPSIGQFRRR